MVLEMFGGLDVGSDGTMVRISERAVKCAGPQNTRQMD